MRRRSIAGALAALVVPAGAVASHEPVKHSVSVSGKTKKVDTPATPGTIEDHGALTGTPFGKGSIVLVGKFGGGRFTGTFKLTYKEGTVKGTASLPFVITGNEIDFNGTARFTGGTGHYKGITGGKLKVHDHNTLDGQNGTLTVKGSAKY